MTVMFQVGCLNLGVGAWPSSNRSGLSGMRPSQTAFDQDLQKQCNVDPTEHT